MIQFQFDTPDVFKNHAFNLSAEMPFKISFHFYFSTSNNVTNILELCRGKGVKCLQNYSNIKSRNINNQNNLAEMKMVDSTTSEPHPFLFFPTLTGARDG